MSAVLAIVERLLGLVLQALGILQSLQSASQRTAVEHTAFAIETIAANATNALNHPTHGLAALASKLDAVQATLNAGVTVATLPVDPPPAYGGVHPETVWGFVTSPGEPTVYQMLRQAWSFGINVGREAAFPLRHNPNFIIEATWFTDAYVSGIGTEFWPTPDWADIRPDDTRLSWLQRTDPSTGWVLDPNSGEPVAWGEDAWSTAACRPNFTELDFETWKLTLRSRRQRFRAMYPDADDVQFLDTIALDRHVSFTGECHGIIVHITGWPAEDATYDWGTFQQYPRAGYVAFRGLLGEHEAVQPITFGDEVIVPAMYNPANGFDIRCRPGVAGTVRPFVILP